MKKRVLITGASGFLGEALCRHLTDTYEVVAMSRKPVSVDNIEVHQGDFCQVNDLAWLDSAPVDAVIHLGAVTGGCSESDGITVNVEGSRVLIKRLLETGTRKFVLASSIAVVGIKTPLHPMDQFPIVDEHPCYAKDGYGLSKYLMEEVSRYYSRQEPSAEIVAIRLSAIFPDERVPALRPTAEPANWALGTITQMAQSDAVELFTRAFETSCGDGLHIMNGVCPQAWTEAPTLEVLQHWYGGAVAADQSTYVDDPHASAFEFSRAETMLGFRAKVLPQGAVTEAR